MLTKDDLKAIKEIVGDAIGEFAKDIFVPFTTYVENKFEKVGKDISSLKEDVSVLKEDVSVLKEDVSVLKEDVAGIKSDMEDMERKMDAAFSRDDRQDSRLKKLEKKVGLPAFA